MNEGILHSFSDGGYASEGFARRSVWRGATGVSPWGSTVKRSTIRIERMNGRVIRQKTFDGRACPSLQARSSVGERFLDTEEVGSSILPVPTILP